MRVQHFEVFKIDSAEANVKIISKRTPAINAVEQIDEQSPFHMLVLAQIIRNRSTPAHFFLVSLRVRSKQVAPTSEGGLSGSSKRNRDTFLTSVTGRENRMARISLSEIFGSGAS